jgi:hypothetical protein
MAEGPDPRSGLDAEGNWEPAFPGQRPPLRPGHEHRVGEGNQLALKSGVYSARKLAPLAEEIYGELRAAIVPWEPVFELATRTVADIRARQELAAEWLSENGLVDAGGDVRPLVKELPRWEARQRELLAEMAATVRSRAALELNRQETIAVSEFTEFLRRLRDGFFRALPPEFHAVIPDVFVEATEVIEGHAERRYLES